MAKEKTVHLPLTHTKRILKVLGLRYSEKALPDGNGIQLRLAEDAFNGVSVNVYHSRHTILVQPHDSPEAEFVRMVLRLRSLRLRQRGEIS